MNHYVYYIADKSSKHFYYGSRSCECDPINDNYLGSMTRWEPNKENLIKRILGVYNSRQEANKEERNLIKRDIKNPFNENYHIPSVGFRTYGMKHTEETKRKIGASNSGNTFSKDAIRKMSIAKKGKNHWLYGKKRPDKVCQKISKSRMGMSFTDGHKKNIAKSKTGSRNPNYGKRRKQDTIDKIKESNCKKPILQMDMEGNVIKEWIGQSIAAESLGISRRGINNCLNGRSYSSGNYKWKYKN